MALGRVARERVVVMRELFKAPEGAAIVQIDHTGEEARIAADLAERLSKLNRHQRRGVIARARKKARAVQKKGSGT